MMQADDALASMRDYAREHHVPILHPDTVGVLSEVIKRRQPKAILEIGTAIGYSALIMAVHASPAVRITSLEKDPDRLFIARKYLHAVGLDERVQLLAGDALEIIPQLHTTFDMVFIDAAKGQYLNCLLLVLAKLEKQAVIVADNVLFRGMVAADQEPPRRYRTLVRRLREYLHFVTTDPRFTTTLSNAGDGVAISYYQGEST